MRKEMESKFNSPLPGGLSVLSVDFTSKGLSWAGNIYQKWENICLDNILIQTPCKYADAFGEHFKKILNEVADDWLNPCNGCGKEPVSDLPSEHEVICEVCENSKLGHDEKSMTGKYAMSVELKPLAVAVKDYCPGTPIDVPRGLEDVKGESNSTVAEDTSSSLDGTLGTCKNVSEPVASVYNSDVGSAFLSREEVLQPASEWHKEVQEGAEFLGQTAPEKMNGGIVSETTDEVYKEDNVSHHEEMELEGFEDLYLDKSGDDFERCEVIIVPHHALNKTSFKKKLRQLFSSKIRSSKEDFIHRENGCADINVRTENQPGSSASSVSKECVCPAISSTHNSSETDWELL